MLKARAGQPFKEYISKNNLDDLSLAAPGEQYDAVFAAEMREIERITK